MLAVPPAILDLLRLKAGARVGIRVEDGRLVIEPAARPHYTLSELLDASEGTQPLSAEEREWIESPPVGGEIL